MMTIIEARNFALETLKSISEIKPSVVVVTSKKGFEEIESSEEDQLTKDQWMTVYVQTNQLEHDHDVIFDKIRYLNTAGIKFDIGYGFKEGTLSYVSCGLDWSFMISNQDDGEHLEIINDLEECLLEQAGI